MKELASCSLVGKHISPLREPGKDNSHVLRQRMHREVPLICARSHHHSEAPCFLTTKSVLKPHSVVTAVVHGAILALSEQSSEWGWHCAGVTQGAVPTAELCSVLQAGERSVLTLLSSVPSMCLYCWAGYSR